ncbi:GxxExxY protein [Reyranella sp. CPCC 100927]|uniref:GxxExxY protein n=1 Tax=Reyranella sp. CPCC 100927 TaxID=2599616 RepID=UPI0011B6136A|nr:GxxExxY protein [Reyranella sp. CPCC 100927]TWT01259.1 GxxExxY protein [Reyranella sp. CPCC 100927]
MERDLLTDRVIGLAIDVHRALGPGLLESAYEACLCRELELANIRFKRQVPLPIDYKGLRLEAYRLDIVVDDCLILEIKAVERLIPIHEAQLLTYLKLSKLKVGLLLNFGAPMLKEGIKRLIL